ncbi:MAG TPA: KpsF/GutQ family sugar-phosphate isomerase [Rhizomicrobium sp.]|nr:KpsF/GutQ family sugar-phosphate isomerase [Rhizomicrobium sp.]
MLDGDFTRAVDVMLASQDHQRPGRVIVSGMGKSGHVARKIAATFASTGSPAFFVHPAEASHGDLGMIGPDDVIVALSKSGQAPELADVLAYAKRFAIPLIAITADPASALGTAASVVLTLAASDEATAEINAPTTSTTLQIALGDALAVALLERRGFKPADFHVFHPGGKIGAMLRTVGDLMHGADELPLVTGATPMQDALLVMTEKRWGIVGVTDDAGQLIGAVTDGDLRRHIVGLMDHTAGEVMTPGPRKTVPPGMLASEALALMSDPPPAVTVLFVVDAGKPVGILHVHDILRAGVM